MKCLNIVISGESWTDIQELDGVITNRPDLFSHKRQHPSLYTALLWSRIEVKGYLACVWVRGQKEWRGHQGELLSFSTQAWGNLFIGLPHLLCNVHILCINWVFLKHIEAKKAEFGIYTFKFNLYHMLIDEKRSVAV